MIRSTVATMALVLLLAGCGDKPAAPEGAGEHAGEEHGNGESHEAGEESAGKDEHAEGEGEEGHEEGPPSTTMTDAVAKRSGVQVAPVTAFTTQPAIGCQAPGTVGSPETTATLTAYASMP